MARYGALMLLTIGTIRCMTGTDSDRNIRKISNTADIRRKLVYDRHKEY
jgi:hypothetical protein